ncbi:isoprenylcysteine carboxylmethyltransferase family protein [Nocardia sp. NPDC051030]|uniref:methyltransferase family protein n=1 Tax=Nocardia sp. NPDC051030 TaxID=3155162 RepID=UPI0034408565
MKSLRPILGSLLFTIVVPGTVAGLLPLWISGWRIEHELIPTQTLRVIGVVLILAGLPILLGAIYRFAVEGLGTPAPIAPTRHLVVGGPNRYVRNPMYLAVVSMALGQALLFSQFALLWYAVLIAVGQALFVRFYEEPTLHRQFGADYDEYRQAVPAWIPRRTPWKPALKD